LRNPNKRRTRYVWIWDALANASYRTGILLWKKSIDEEKCLQQLREQIPGLNEETYRMAMTKGRFESMW